MFKIGFKYGGPDKYISNFFLKSRGKWGRNLLAGVIQYLETNAQGLTGNVNGQVELGVEERFQL